MADSLYNSITATDELRVTSDGALRIVSINRPDERNAVTGTMHRALADLWNVLDSDSDARAVLLRSEGDTFTAGADYSWFKEQVEDPSELERAIFDGRRILEGIIRCRIPVVTAVQGGAVGLGASLAVLSDLVVMSEDAFYRDPHVALGLTAGDGGIAWPGSVGMQITKQYVLLGERLHAAEAYRLGMVNKVVPRSELDNVAVDFAHRLAKLPARAAQSTKRALNMQLERGLIGAAEFALAAEHFCAADPNFAERVQNL